VISPAIMAMKVITTQMASTRCRVSQVRSLGRKAKAGDLPALV